MRGFCPYGLGEGENCVCVCVGGGGVRLRKAHNNSRKAEVGENGGGGGGGGEIMSMLRDIPKLSEKKSKCEKRRQKLRAWAGKQMGASG